MQGPALRRAAALSAVAALFALAFTASSARAITTDYCGRSVVQTQHCNDSSGYRGWRYHQASTGGGPTLPHLCAVGVTQAGNVRTPTGCSSLPSAFIAFQYCDADPPSLSYVAWYGTDGAPVLYGHADSRTCGLSPMTASLGGQSTLPPYIADRFADPTSAGQAGVDPASATPLGQFGQQQIFTLSGPKSRCVLRSGPDGFATACTTYDQLARAGGRQAVTEMLEDGQYRVFGIAGSDTQATVATATGQVVAPVSPSGAFAITVHGAPTRVTFQGAGGRRVVDAGIA